MTPLNDLEREALSVLAYVMLESGRPEKAAALLDGLDALLPGNPATLQSLAVAQLRAGRPAEALHTVDRLLARDTPGARITWLVQAQALQALGRRSEAFVAMERYLTSHRAMAATAKGYRP